MIMPKVMTYEKMARLVYLRSIGFTEEEIARELGVSQEVISYNLKKIKERAAIEGPIAPFSIFLAGMLDAGAGNLAEFLFGKQVRLFSCPECGKPIFYKISTCPWCRSQLTDKDWVEKE